MKYYYDPQNRLPYKKRLRNRCIAITLFVIICASIGSCIYISGSNKEKNLIVNGVQHAPASTADSIQSAADQYDGNHLTAGYDGFPAQGQQDS